MIERIMNAGPLIPVKKYEVDFNKHLQFKNNIKKSQPIPVDFLVKKKQKKLDEVSS